MEVSIVSPAYNEAESIAELVNSCQEVLRETHLAYEVILIDDGSTDHTWAEIEKQCRKSLRVKGVRLKVNQGKSQALNIGFYAAKGRIVITLDSDLQDSPSEIPKLYREITEKKYDLISGWKYKRYDSFIKVQTSKIFNYVTRKFSGISLNDFNSGIKAYRCEVVKDIHLYNEMHRYIPVIAKSLGYTRIGELKVKHRKRKYGHTKFGYERFFYGVLDLLSLWFLNRFSKRPMHFFGSLGIILFILGFSLSLYLGLVKLYYLNQSIKAPLISKNAWFYISLSCMTIGVNLFLSGFLGELINSWHRNKQTEAGENRYNQLIRNRFNLD